MAKIPRTAAFKKKIALDALKEDKTLGQLASQHGVHPMQISKWKRELIDGAETIFERKGPKRKRELIEREDLERKIGQMTVELDYLKKKLGICP
jgi:transposase-like protein